MSNDLKIDFVSDVSCPWCAIGLAALREALGRIGAELAPDLSFQPFELNPGMPPGGEDTREHLSKKYGSGPEEQARIYETIRGRGAEVGFRFRDGGRERIYNTFDAHRLLHWAGLPDTRRAGLQLALKQALFEAYFTNGESPESHEVLLRTAIEVGLDGERAREILAGDDYAEEVLACERYYREAGIHAVPAVIIDDTHLISGAQSVDFFEETLRGFAGQRS